MIFNLKSAPSRSNDGKGRGLSGRFEEAIALSMEYRFPLRFFSPSIAGDYTKGDSDQKSEGSPQVGSQLVAG